MQIDENIAYVLGLIAGRGYIDTQNKRLIIEFAHKNKYIKGIPKCPECGGIVKVKREDNPDKAAICDSCKRKIKAPSYKISFDQRKEVISHIEKKLSKELENISKDTPEITGNKFITYLSVSFKNNKPLFEFIVNMFSPATSYESFEIPTILYKSPENIKLEFCKGVADTAGFPTWSGWIMRSEGDRARIYLQIVRNWKFPVLICNFLQDYLGVPIQTIDWGHPNIRDPDMIEYIEKKGGTSWGREHQVKIFAEGFKKVGFKFPHKQKVFEELVAHNESIGFPAPDKCVPPYKIRPNQFKIKHEGEDEKRLPPELKGKHFDAYWQVCWKLGCSQIRRQKEKFNNSEYCFITGAKDYESKQKIGADKLKKIYAEIEEKREQKLKNAKQKWSKIEKEKKPTIRKERSSPEASLYEPMRKWLEKFLMKKFGGTIHSFDTSKQYLSNFLSQADISNFEYFEDYNIKPDVVAIAEENNKFAFIEAKIGPLTLKDVGQLLGYCQVAKPDYAILLSPEAPSRNLTKIITTNQEITKYDTRKIVIAQWDMKNNVVDLSNAINGDQL